MFISVTKMLNLVRSPSDASLCAGERSRKNEALSVRQAKPTDRVLAEHLKTAIFGGHSCKHDETAKQSCMCSMCISMYTSCLESDCTFNTHRPAQDASSATW